MNMAAYGVVFLNQSTPFYFKKENLFGPQQTGPQPTPALLVNKAFMLQLLGHLVDLMLADLMARQLARPVKLSDFKTAPRFPFGFEKPLRPPKSQYAFRAEYAAPPQPPQTPGPSKVEQLAQTVQHMRSIAEQFDISKANAAKLAALESALHACASATLPQQVKQAQAQFKVKFDSLARGLQLLTHPDKNTADQARTAFLQIGQLKKNSNYSAPLLNCE